MGSAVSGKTMQLYRKSVSVRNLCDVHQERIEPAKRAREHVTT